MLDRKLRGLTRATAAISILIFLLNCFPSTTPARIKQQRTSRNNGYRTSTYGESSSSISYSYTSSSSSSSSSSSQEAFYKIEEPVKCYNDSGFAQMCSSAFVNAAYLKNVEATNTCGDNGPETFCPRTALEQHLPASCSVCYADSFPASHLTDLHMVDQRTWWQSSTMMKDINYPTTVNLTIDLGQSLFVHSWVGRQDGCFETHRELAHLARPPEPKCIHINMIDTSRVVDYFKILARRWRKLLGKLLEDKNGCEIFTDLI
ncbi:hypothetical protein HELRODRAFT_179489 [Helobdella robusta]|uniref:Laminin N-terminal domain-containing protein n=1 Tax=Helobdella robusta TaxID=6412 RepID=T1FES7_HELRO|nr:hypothetical protein HELRODRAFT_179489 [Helobdella robusta]ESN95414.1 hypothetical protein HELRODRAFT_179489 [Helobdella robusta]